MNLLNPKVGPIPFLRLGKSQFRFLLNQFLEKFGLAVCRSSTLEKAARFTLERQRHLMIIKETEHFLRAFSFSDLPANEKRAELITQLIGVGPYKAFYIINYLHQALKVPGAICEFGVAEGATSALLGNEVVLTDRHLWLFDSFKGLSKPKDQDILINDIFNLGSMDKYEGKMAWPQEKVKTRLKDVGFPESKTHIIPGFIEETAKSRDLPDKIAFAYVDFDFYEPILTALNLLHSRLSIGSFVVIDDYNYFSAGAATAVNVFFEAHKTLYRWIEPRPYCSGFVILERVS